MMADSRVIGGELRDAYLDALGVKQWRLREADDAQTSPLLQQHDRLAQEHNPDLSSQARVSKEPGYLVDTEKVSTLDLAELQLYVRGCQACDLHKTRKQTVFGNGHHKADWLIIGEAPGADEDRQGEPFVGRAGQLLTQMLRAIGLAREEVFITNVLKCRPPNNRDPNMAEITACQAYLYRQIELLEPKIILVLGRIAAQSILNSDIPIGKMRGQLYHLEKYAIPLVVTYHPAYLLRSPKEKRKVWEDLKLARQQMVAQE